MREVHIPPHSIDRYVPVIGQADVDAARAAGERARTRTAGRVVWNVNSTARGGGVAEILSTLLPYVRGLGIDVRWLVIDGNPEFFRVTKRLHHALHGQAGDGSALGPAQRDVYEDALRGNAREISALVRPRDIVILHDPQTAGLAPELLRAGAVVIWRCHIGADVANDQVDLGWDFLERYLDGVPAFIFTRAQYVPECCDRSRSVIIAPAIDPFSAKNQELDADTVRAILVHTGIVEGPPGPGQPLFLRGDGSPERVDRQADITRLGRAPVWETPLVVQVSRWDPLKDPIGVMDGFAQILDDNRAGDADLVLAGPNVTAIADDPEGAETLDGVVAHWRGLPHGHRGRIHLACLPMADGEENAAIVNALQRRAAIVVQKSLHEGFGLTVAEAMWKARPVVGSAVGGIQEQIEDGVSGLLLKDPADLGAFGGLLQRLIEDPARAGSLGEAARERVRGRYLGLRQLVQHAELLERIDA
ncbi:MAG TPA: glycosyltransferase [Dehalococcoidia bacterium]|nr:glycosyltransferase [Dehalococcoidia bacterium]